MRIALISDTHNHLDPRVPRALAGADHILHAGDIGSEAILDSLREIAPVTAVYGNNDPHLAEVLPLRVDIGLAGARIHLVHRVIDAEPPPGTSVVIFGHSHKALIEDRAGVLYVNPGAAGRVGFHREVTVAWLEANDGVCRAEIVLLGPRLPSGLKRP